MRFEFRFESLKSSSVSILSVSKLMIGSSKSNGEKLIDQENAFEHKKKKCGLKLTPG